MQHRSVPDRLFVYGTLRRCLHHPLQRRLEQAALAVKRARVSGRLFDFGAYPGLILATDRAHWVVGETYLLRNQPLLWRELDQYEAYDASRPKASLFLRRRVSVDLIDSRESQQAWVYVFNRPVLSAVPINSGDYCAYRRGHTGRQDACTYCAA